jgi:hypothetical protein
MKIFFCILKAVNKESDPEVRIRGSGFAPKFHGSPPLIRITVTSTAARTDCCDVMIV